MNLEATTFRFESLLTYLSRSWQKIKSHKFLYKFFSIISLVVLITSQQALAFTADDYSCAAQGDNGGTCFYDPNATCSAGAVGTTTTPIPGNDNEEKIFNYFVAKGLTAFQAAGIDGNFGQESHWNPDDPGGYLAQWSPDRLASLAQLAQKEGMPETDLSTELDFAWQELNSDYKPVLDNLKATTNVSDATNTFMGPSSVSGQPVGIDDPSQRSGGYEDPDIPAGHNRLTYAQDALSKYGGGVSSDSGGGDSSGTDDGTDACATTASGDTTDCTTATGDAKILCIAKEWNGVYYEFGGGHEYGFTKFNQMCPDPSQAPDNTQFGGPSLDRGRSGNPSPCAVDCSSLVSFAVDKAFGLNDMWTVLPNGVISGSDSNLWKKVPISQAQPGDVVTLSDATGHIEVVDHVSGDTVYTFGARETGTKDSAISQPASAWTGGAFEWTGTGSGQ
jgi:hypothetical protein